MLGSGPRENAARWSSLQSRIQLPLYSMQTSANLRQFLAQSKHSVNQNGGNDDGDDGSLDDDGLKNKLATFIRYRFG